MVCKLDYSINTSILCLANSVRVNRDVFPKGLKKNIRFSCDVIESPTIIVDLYVSLYFRPLPFYNVSAYELFRASLGHSSSDPFRSKLEAQLLHPPRPSLFSISLILFYNGRPMETNVFQCVSAGSRVCKARRKLRRDIINMTCPLTSHDFPSFFFSYLGVRRRAAPGR